MVLKMDFEIKQRLIRIAMPIEGRFNSPVIVLVIKSVV